MLARAPTTPPTIITLVLISAASALSMNVFLPSLPGMSRYFDVDYSFMQLTVSVYLFSTALLQLFIGPLSDRIGRRPVLIYCFLIFLVATVGAIYAPNFEFLLAMRVMQAFSAAGMVLSRAIVRDLFEPAKAASMIGYVTMGMALAPMIGPLVGGVLDDLFGWQATFVLMLVFGIMSIGFIYFDLGETNQNLTESFRAQFRTYPELLKSRRFWGYVLTAGFTAGQFFAFLGGGPFVATEILKLSPSEYGLFFGIISAGYIVGNFVSGRYSERIGIIPMMLTGNLLATSGVILALILLFLGWQHPVTVFGPMVMTGIGNGISLPSASAGIVSVRPHLAGSASGLGSAIQIGLGAVLSVLGGAFLTLQSGAFPLLWVMMLASIVGVAFSIYVHVIERSLR